MRPRVFPAEDRIAENRKLATSKGFNEAAGIPRGRHRYIRSRCQTGRASMRPRVFPAEDSEPYFVFIAHSRLQ